MVRKSVLLFVSMCTIFVAIAVALLEKNDSICFGGGYGVNSLSGEFQTVFHEVKVGQAVMRNRVLRGKVTSYAYLKKDSVLAGELDVSVLKNEYLSELIELEDKDGFFIINTKTGSVLSGLNKSDFSSHVRKLTGEHLSLKPIGYFDRFYWNCL